MTLHERLVTGHKFIDIFMPQLIILLPMRTSGKQQQQQNE